MDLAEVKRRARSAAMKSRGEAHVEAGETAPGILAYARHPWVVANDLLTAAGWVAENSNEEAYVVGHEARAIESITPQRRQELALGAAGAVVAASVAGVVALVRRRHRTLKP